ncbi:hypothetical protein HanHA300_Chr10g0359051 [Helianthus annuus]|nr:hypothetical protein HanHA300_Chr10g0359051 [Helianthus annuus]KAJ0529657.1 hypothetical protein HanHA89_Chr10g0380501 [Helianthus annuus]
MAFPESVAAILAAVVVTAPKEGNFVYEAKLEISRSHSRSFIVYLDFTHIYLNICFYAKLYGFSTRGLYGVEARLKECMQLVTPRPRKTTNRGGNAGEVSGDRIIVSTTMANKVMYY